MNLTPTKLLLGLLTASLTFSGCAATQPKQQDPMDTVVRVNLDKYMGKWYEIASIPVKEQANCTGTTATYSLKGDNKVKVVNECYENRLDGPLKKAEATAWAPNPKEPSKLKVQFFWPFAGDYWILELDQDYKYAMVGEPTRKYLWILSRDRTMEDETYQMLLKKAKSHGYDLDRLKQTLHINQGRPMG